MNVLKLQICDEELKMLLDLSTSFMLLGISIFRLLGALHLFLSWFATILNIWTQCALNSKTGINSAFGLVPSKILRIPFYQRCDGIDGQKFHVKARHHE